MATASGPHSGSPVAVPSATTDRRAVLYTISTAHLDGNSPVFVRQVVLAAEFGITQAAVSNIVRRKTWKHVI